MISDPAPSDTATDAEREKLRRLVVKHKGNQSAIARALSGGKNKITRQGVKAQLVRLGLFEDANALALASHQPGPRAVPAAALKEQREQLLNVLASVETYADAPKLLKVSSMTMYRRIKLHKITPRQVANRKKQLARTSK